MISDYEDNYSKLVDWVFSDGHIRSSRAGDTISLFNQQLTFDLSGGIFPLLAGRKMHYKGVLGELAAMLRGGITNVSDFTRFGCNYWGPWADASTGALRLDYGNSWRDFNGTDQLKAVINSLRTDPFGRRHIISGWRPDRLSDLSLPCCHMLYQWYVTGNNTLDMMWYQRSTDVMIGLPSDAILAAAWTILLAKEVGLRPGKVEMSLGDTHIYLSHTLGMKQYLKQVKEVSKNSSIVDPAYYVSKDASVLDFNPDHISISGYSYAEPINFPISV